MKPKAIYQYSVAYDKLRDKAIRLHHQRYMEVGFFKENEKDHYESLSTYFTAQKPHDGEVVGVTRLIFAKLEQLPTISNFNIYDIEKARLTQLERSRYAEISAFTKMPDHDVGMGLIRTVLQYSLVNGVTHWICCIDERVYNYMHKMFKFPFRVIGVPQIYLGSQSIPCLLDLSECLSILRERRSSLHEYLMLFEKEAAGAGR
jgi:N-acyl-L-homoserine lactone synthetase